MSLNRNGILLKAALAALLFLPLCCTKEGTDNGAIVEKVIGISMAEPAQTKAVLHQYDTSEVKHPVAWKTGDRIWCYSESGIYMDYTLTGDDLSSDGYLGKKAKAHIVYRYGDEWVTCYSKGPSIGDYIGARKEKLLVLENGIPREQTGRFDDTHVCIVRSHPDTTDYVFENVQSYLRFELTEPGGAGIRNGKLMDQYVTKITVHSLTPGQILAGDLRIIDEAGWRTILQDRGEPADSVITVIPSGGHFEPASATFDGHYFVAVPVRRYANGIRLNMYTDNGAAKGYVDLPATTITKNYILNCHDLLKFCAIYVDALSFKYGQDENVAEISIVAGHSGKLQAVISPETATDKALLWELEGDDDTVCTVAQDGTVTALASGIGRSCTVRCTAKDRGTVSNTVTVSVVPDASVNPGGYDVPDPFVWQ